LNKRSRDKGLIGKKLVGKYRRRSKNFKEAGAEGKEADRIKNIDL
jgi:hypothetical protein